MPTRTVNDGYYVDGATGEVVPVAANTTIMGAEEREGYRRKAELSAEKKELVAVQKDLCGDFYWTLFESRETYYPDVSDSMLAKIIYLITYMDYETNLLVMQDSATSPKRPMLKKDVAAVIRLHRCNFARFWDELLETGIIKEEPDGKLRVCPLFCKGRITTKNKAAMKIFTHAVRYMYENIDVRSHPYISYLFRLIPYINLRYNVFCQNPLETEKSEVVRMTAKDMCHIRRGTHLEGAAFHLFHRKRDAFHVNCHIVGLCAGCDQQQRKKKEGEFFHGVADVADSRYPFLGRHTSRRRTRVRSSQSYRFAIRSSYRHRRCRDPELTQTEQYRPGHHLSERL